MMLRGGEMKVIIWILIIVLAGSAFAQADEFSAAKQLISSNVSCDKLNDRQLESIGDYFMEQTHPGAQHVAMENMMGGEGSESLRRAHLQMAQVLYCRRADTPLTYGGMMGMMPLMMGGYYAQGAPGAFVRGPGMTGGGYGGMMGAYGAFGWSLFDLLAILLLLGLIAAVYLHIFQKLKNRKPKK